MTHGIEHLPGLLSRDGGVEEGQGLSVDHLLEDREIGPNPGRVELRLRRNGHEAMVPPGVEAPDGTATLGRMRSRPVLLALAVLTLTAAGCGGGEKASDTNLPGDTAKGKQVFATAGCAGCHTLRAANATGTQGPNLDTVGPGYQRVVEQVTKGSPAMPSFEFKLDKDQIRNVAAFVAD